MSIASRLRPTSAHGMTMVELIIFIIVISVAIAGVLLVMNVNTSRSGDAQLRKQALSIAEALLEQVESARFTYCDWQSTNATSAATYSQCTVPENVGPEAGDTFPYDNVNDYVTALGTQQTIKLQDVNTGSVIAQTGTYVPCITISKATLAGMETDTAANPSMGSTLLIRIDVYVQTGASLTCGTNTASLTPVVSLEGYRTEYAPYVMP